jgi:hypothetical protein
MTASGWQANPKLSPHGALETLGVIAGVYALWFFNAFVLLLLFAGLPWLALHKAGGKRPWIAPLAGFAVAFCIGFAVTTAPGRPSPELKTSAWIDDKPTMIGGHLTPYGKSLYGTAAGLRSGAMFGLFGALVGFALWRMGYRRER